MLLSIGIPKEIKPRELRVGLVPEAVRELTESGIRVWVEREAGRGSGFKDSDYEAAGAGIVPDKKTLYEKADLIQKVKEPQPAEFGLLREGLILFSYLHLASPSHCGLLDALLASGVTAIAFETVAVGTRHPLLAPMSEIAGALAASYGAYLLHVNPSAGKKIFYPKEFHKDLADLAALYPDAPVNLDAGPVMIWGGGIAGEKALEFALRMKGRVVVVEKDDGRREELKKKWFKIMDLELPHFPDRGRVVFLPPDEISESLLAEAKLMIGCVHQSGRRAVQVLDAARLSAASREQKKVIVDVAIDQGGNFPGASPRTYEDPVELDGFGNIRFTVANMPSLCGRGASEALSRATLPYTKALAADPDKAFRKFSELMKGINVSQGQIRLEAVREAHKR